MIQVSLIDDDVDISFPTELNPAKEALNSLLCAHVPLRNCSLTPAKERCDYLELKA